AGWSAPPATPQAEPQAAFGGGSAGQPWNPSAPQTSDPWAANPANPAQAQFQGMSPAPAPAAAALPSWQQQGGASIPQDQNAAFFGGANSDRTMLRSGPASALPQSTVGIVRVEEGKEPGRVYEIRKETLSIGRSRESDIFLEDLAVSRLHASILNMGNGNYALKDEGSANGTKINNQLVNKYQTYPLQDGDRIQLGQTVLVFGRR
ncbi:MAG: FHA domain-containing protein, partial [Ktedonobacteraceae bacterium]|nr:FHA domain-containing protein [Ktedonobacteraceae bacterium]